MRARQNKESTVIKLLKMKDFQALLLWFCLSSTTGQEDIRLPPSVTKGPVMHAIFRTDDQATLECKGDGVPLVTYEWKKNGFTLNLNQENIRMGPDGTITIQPATSLDEGFYQCYVTNQYGTAVSTVSHIQRAFIESSSGTPTVLHKTVRQGEPFHIQAVPKRSLPKATFGWEIARDTNDKTPSTLQLSRRLQIADNGDLYFAYALPEDDFYSRFYRSTSFNPFLNISSIGGYTNLTVTTDAGKVPQFVPTLQFSSEPVNTAMVGSSVSLRCIFAGYPEASVSWRGPKNTLPIGRFKTEKFATELTIMNVMPQDKGDYTCTANNPSGFNQHTLQLLVEAAPSFKTQTDGPYNINATEGNDVTFNCAADADPPATITWLQNGELIDANYPPKRYVVYNAKKSLKIKSVCRDCDDRDKETDLTVIQCNASNVHGHAFRSGYVNVLKKTVVIPSVTVEVSVEMYEDRQFDFPCRAISDPSTPPTVTWYKVNEATEEQLLHDDPPYLTIHQGTLTIRADQNGTKDWRYLQGEYHCVASNGYSKATQVVKLTLQDYIPKVPEYDRYISPWIFILIACIAVLVLIAIGLGIYMCFRRRDQLESESLARYSWHREN